MVREAAPGIFCIPIPLPRNPLKELNSYLITGPRNLLIDTGFRREKCRAAMTAALDELGVDMTRTDIFLTHLHTDHTGLAPELASPSSRIYISEYDRTRMPGAYDRTSWTRSDDTFRRNGMPAAVLEAQALKNPMHSQAPRPYDDYLAVQDGDTFAYGSYALRAIATPGHTPGHLCLWDEAHQILFSGDHVLFDITPNVTKWADVPDSLGDYLQSLAAIRDLPARLVLPGHRTVSCSLPQRVDALIAHHEARCREVLGILSAAPATAWETASKMHWDIRADRWEDFPAAQQWFAMGEALAHLDHLHHLGRIRPQEASGRITWTLC